MIPLLLGSLLLAAGGVVAAWIGGRFDVLRRLALLAVWWIAPFVVLFIALASATDPTLTAERAGYNFWLGFGLITTVAIVPWSVAVLIGAVIGYNRGKKRATVTKASAAPVAWLPRQWVPGDTTLLNADALNRDIDAFAARGGLDPALVARAGPPVGGGVSHIEIDLDDRAYQLIATEHGREVSRRRTDVVECLLYWIANETTYRMAERSGGSPADIRARQSELMQRAAPQWHAGWLADPEAKTKAREN